MLKNGDIMDNIQVVLRQYAECDNLPPELITQVTNTDDKTKLPGPLVKAIFEEIYYYRHSELVIHLSRKF